MNTSKNPKYFAYLVALTIITLMVIISVPVNAETNKDLNQVHVASTVNNTESLHITKDDTVFVTETLEMFIEKKQTVIAEKKPVVKEKKKDRYIITAYYLNVREKYNTRSKVTNVLERGEIVEVNRVGKEWISLTNGGYIYSKYAVKYTGQKISKLPVPVVKPIKTSFKQSNIKTQVYVPKSSGNKINNPAITGIDSKSNLTIDDLVIILDGTNLQGIEAAVLEIEEKHNVNALFTIAVAKLESGNGTSRIARNKNNLFGLNAIDGDAYNKAFSYSTKSDSVIYFGKLIDKKYVGKGRNTLAKINSIYSVSSEWRHKVAKIISSDISKI